MIDAIHTVILWACLAFLAVIATIYAYHAATRVWRVLRGSLRGWHLFAFAVVACVCTIYARKGRVTFPRTDPTVSYLVDRGSYVTNDLVHIEFTRTIVPDSATMFVDYRPVESTNDADWVTHSSRTFAEWSPPLEIAFDNATNYDWVVYTDWTPGQTVRTNGVWQAVWGQSTNKVFILPLRTAVRVNGNVIATPKSKEDAENENH